jgi:hypothetical protein
MLTIDSNVLITSSSAATVADTYAESLSPNVSKSVDPLELGQLKTQGCTAKVDSIRSRLGSENEFDGVTGGASVESSSESKIGLIDSEN